jgi:hypothetical protein
MVKPWLLGALLKTLAFAEDFEVRGEAAVGWFCGVPSKKNLHLWGISHWNLHEMYRVYG